MSGITLVSINPGLETRVLDLFGRSTSVRRVWSDQWRDPVEAAMDCSAADPELMIIGSDLPNEKARLLVAEVDRRFPATTILVLAAGRDTDVALDLLRLGARDVIDEAGLEQSRPEIDRLLELARARRQSTSSVAPTLRRRVITILSPKGGTGKTTMAVNLGVGLAHRQPNQVALVDLDMQFADCATCLGLQPQASMVDALKSLGHDRNALKVFFTAHHSGLALLSPPEDLAAADTVEPDDLKRLIGAVAEEFPFVVIDTSAGIDAACIAAMELSTDLLLVTTTDVPAIRALRRQVEALDRIGMMSQRRTFVLNRANAKVGLSVSDVEAAIGMEASFQIPSSRIVPQATNEGTPVIEREGGNLAARFEEIASYFAPTADDRPRTLFRGRRKDR